ncbi:hypothetical protein ACFVX9_30630 [Kitasatospora sp. NPDC058243]|uniref:hypothetical protein n=1 Tax=Kitasatospora sp. NPDC058243 TaxID=3346397 RepID=UPI0036DAD913
MSPIIPYTLPETATAVRGVSELELNALLDALLAEIAMPAALLVFDDPWLDVLYGPLPELPAWSPETVALVAEYSARTGGAR